MANYQLLKADIDEKVYQNGHQEITGENLNYVLNAMVTTLGAEYQFAGVATIDTNPSAPDAKVFYIANGKGTYTNFGGINVTEDDVVVLYWDTAWHKVSTGIASQEKLSELESNVNEVTSFIQNNSIEEELPATASASLMRKKISFKGEVVALEASIISVINCQPGQKFRVISPAKGSTGAYLYAFYNSDTTFSPSTLVAIGPEINQAHNDEIVCPEGATTLLFQRYFNYDSNFRINAFSRKVIVSNLYGNNVVKLDTDGFYYIKSRYNESYDICFVIGKRGGNNLPDFSKVYLIDNTTGELNADFTQSTLIFQNSTDSFSPYIVGARQNVDGDNPQSYYFTGGNHRSTNEETGGVPTATCESLVCYADGNIVGATPVFANEVCLTWVNKVQAYNTTKTDGTGRYVLKERISLNIVGNAIKCEIKQTALEKIRIITYYGMQFDASQFDNLFFIGGQSRQKATFPTNAESDNLTCKSVVVRKETNDLSVEMFVEPIDLGRFDLLPATASSLFARGYVGGGQKVYMQLVNANLDGGSFLEMTQGDEAYTRGGYFFKFEE